MKPTPTDTGLPLRAAAFDTLPEALDYAAKGRGGLNFYNARGELTASLSHRELRERAIAAARGLVRAGLPPEARMLIIAETEPDFFVLFCACQYASVVPVPVAVPTSLGGRDSYIAALRRQLAGSAAAAAAAPAALLGYLKEAALGTEAGLVGSFTDILDLPTAGADPRPFGPGDSSYLQYSSGSTRFPLGVDIPQATLMSNARAIAVHGLEINPEDRCVSWLPLYHDMGLVGFMLVPLLTQRSADYMPTRDFARRPLMWLTLMSRNGGTLAFSPSFGYDLCTRRERDAAGAGLDLRRWRGAGIGGDMIQPQVMSRFAEIFAPYGFDRRAFVPSYGMAETTLAISFSPLGRGMLLDRVDRRRLAEEQRAVPSADADPLRSRTFVQCGHVLPGHFLEVRGEDGRRLPDRHVGRVFVKGPSVMRGYFLEPEATARAIDGEGWLDTGDLGYMVDGAVTITGRAKDLIIVNGRNIWPQDLEWALEERLGLRRGDAAAFSVESPDGAERVVVLIECRTCDPA
ncbi:MAG: fatty acyl-AMP ligase, partial [Rhodospirillaceae bacterium]|nr:fatty acyl-AMP ligase [Rhodospirillaceae bacterium]